ncbi:hypothetical protein C0995_007422 [Termitomyces sp. Mi166|nr:hypothetical protein C0995_007422 [Termitomyces sp. Mi166\
MSSFRRGVRKPYARPETRGDVNGRWVHDKAPTGPRGTVAVPAPIASTNTKLLVSNLHYEITPKDLTYDRSGRSSGTAIISFETATEATRAKKQFDGILARGQPMSIAFDTLPPRQPRRVVSAPTSLINRIQKPPLVDRLSRDDSSVKTPSGPRGGVGPIRSRPARAPRAPKKPKTAEELDKELDAFMGDAEPAVVSAAATEQVTTEPEPSTQDVEMA